MGAVTTSLLYVTISLALVAIVGRALSRSGRAVLHESAAGQEGVGEAVSRLVLVAWYLLSLGFVALTMPSWTEVGSAGQALRLLSVKLGELLLTLGALHLVSTAVFARLRRRSSWARPPGLTNPDGPAPEESVSGNDTAGGPRADSSGAARAAGGGASLVAPVLWRPRPRQVLH
jgi:hypothetical protein